MLEIREARTTEDYRLIARLADTIWREHYTPIIGEGQVSYMLDRFQSARAIGQQAASGMHYFLLWHEGQPAGYCAYEIRGEELFLSKIYVLQALRGQGMGKEALQFVVERARRENCRQITLTVNKNNAGSIAAYLRMGFRQGPPVQQDIGEGYIMDDYLMTLDL
jgi:RimJ/RimL family protein N-acetyltransferase